MGDGALARNELNYRPTPPPSPHPQHPPTTPQTAPVHVQQRRVGAGLDQVGGRLGLAVLRGDEQGGAELLVAGVDVGALWVGVYVWGRSIDE